MQSLEKSTGATCGVRGVRLAVAAAAVTSEVVSGVKREREGGGRIGETASVFAGEANAAASILARAGLGML